MKKVLIVLWFLGGISFVNAQHYVLDSVNQKLKGLINVEANRLKYADNSPYFGYFFSKLDSLYEGKREKIHIFHIGGSHIQADIYSNKIRTYLQNMNAISLSQRGFVFPYHLAHTNNPSNYRIEADNEQWKGYRSSRRDSVAWGLAGVSAEFRGTVDTVFIKSNYKNYTCEDYCFSKFRIFYNTWDTDYEINVLNQDNLIADTLNKEAAFRQYNFDTDLDSIAVEIRLKDNARQNHQFLLMGMEFMNDDPGIEYTSIGVNGAGFKAYKRCVLFEEQLKLYKPDMFIISIGTNDAYTTRFDTEKFRNNYEDLIKMIQRVNPECAILLTVPNDSYYKRKYANKNTRKEQEIIHELANKYQMAVWDFYDIMGGLGSSNKWYKKKLMPKDRVHFTYLGYNIKADLFMGAMIQQWEKNTNREEGSLLNHFKKLDE